MMKLRTFILVLIIAFDLMSCTTMVRSRATDSVMSPEFTPTMFRETVEPTKTATVVQNPNPTETPFDVNISIEKSLSSPSGKWLALVKIVRVNAETNGKNSSVLIVVDQQTSEERTVEQIGFTSGISYSMPWPLAWSTNEEFLYYTHRFGGGDGCFSEEDFFGTDLYRFNLESGESTQLAPKLGYWLALSPDQTMIAYLTNNSTLGIRNIETGEERETSIHEQQKYADSILTRASHLIWSPDNKELLLTLEVNVCAMEEDTRNSIIKINVETLSQEAFIVENLERPETIAWAENGMILVEDESNRSWWLNPLNGQMTERK